MANGGPRGGAATSSLPRLYVIAGSHACRAAMLMLEHKRVRYRRVELPSGPHGLIVRMLGFPGSPVPIRRVDGGTHRMLAMLDRAGTVPALRYGEQRIQRNREIARFLERELPDPPLFPADADDCAAVEAAEAWGDDALQMAARRILVASAALGLENVHERGGRGRLGPLLARNEPMRLFVSYGAGVSFRAGRTNAAELLAAIPPLLDRVDALIAEGVLNGAEPNVADFTIVSSLALLCYRDELAREIADGPCGAFVDRFLPEPAAARG